MKLNWKLRECCFQNLVVTCSNGYLVVFIERYERGGCEVKFPLSLVKDGSGELLIKHVLGFLVDLKGGY